MHMSSHGRLALFGCVFAIGATLTCATALGGEPNLGDPANGLRLLVRFKPGTTAPVKQAAHAEAQSLRTLKEYNIVPGLQLVQVPAGRISAARNAYENNPNVLYAVPDEPFIRLDAIPDDPYLCALWGLHNTSVNLDGCEGCDVECPDCPAECPYAPGEPDADIDAVQAWDVWTGDPNFRIAVIDTGVDYNHPDLQENMWINPCEDLNSNGRVDPEDFNGIDDECPGEVPNGYVDDVVGYNFLADIPESGYSNHDPMDDHGHGTHVAGTIAAVGDNGIGMTGVNWRAKIVPLKVFDAQGEYPEAPPSTLLGALQYCKDNKIRVSNNSYGWDGSAGCSEPYPDMASAIEDLDDSIPGGHVFIASAGNYGRGCDNHLNNDYVPHYPASYDLENIIAVAATDNNDRLWSDSHYGATTVDLGAPGVNVYSTILSDAVYPYDFWNGTSMAAPHVTGVAALVWSLYPDWTGQQVRHRVLSTVRSVDCEPSDQRCLKERSVTGGVVNAMRAVWYDCNANAVSDELDITCGASLDCRGLESDCCVVHEASGCGDQFIEECVCDAYDGYLAYCCSDTWNSFCVDQAVYCGGGCNDGSDGVPDECQPSRDCDGNLIPDACDLNCEAEALCSNFDCQPGASDCNCNGDLDLACDLESGRSKDCDENDIPDECDILDRRSCDIDENGIPDECDVPGPTGQDCDDNGVPDECDIYRGTRSDCNTNGVPDECDVAIGGGSEDENSNGVPDECEPAILFVDAHATGTRHTGITWCQAFTDLQEAIAVAEESLGAVRQIRVADGTYTPAPPCGSREATFSLVQGVAIRGGYAGCGAPDPDERNIAAFETILSGDLNSDDVLVDINPGPGGGTPDDVCENAGPINTGETFFDTTGATTDGPNPVDCEYGPHTLGSDVWYVYTHSCPTDQVQVSLCGSTYDTFMAVYEGNTCPPTTQLACSDDGCGGQGVPSKLTFSAAQGQAYLIRVGGWQGDTGEGVINITCTALDVTFADNSYHVVTSIGVDDSAILDGFTISGGNAYGDTWPLDVVGGGLYNSSGSPTLMSCTFLQNTAEHRGGAVFSNGGTPKLTNCRFGVNSSAFGGAVSIFDGAPTFVNCFFHGNSGFRGAGVFNYADPSFVNCVFTGNMADGHGGGINSFSGDPTLVNCTFSQNSGDHGGGFAFLYGLPELTNCILWGNTDNSGSVVAAQVYYEDEELDPDIYIIANFCCVQDDDPDDGNVLPGIYNIDDDPKFADPNGEDDIPGTEDDNLRLTREPPEPNLCIDQGNVAVVVECALDADGNHRRWDDPETQDCDAICGPAPIVDRGAFEFGSNLGTDCNSNGLDDACEIAKGSTDDCNSNDVPDVCDIADCLPTVHWCSDCNDNGVPDGCDIDNDPSQDGNGNGILDECEPTVTGLEVFYPGRFLDEPDTSKSFLGAWATATTDNVTNYLGGITGIRVFFDSVVDFATTPEAAFTFEWTTSEGTTFSPVTDPQSSITVTAAEEGGVTVVTIVLAEDYVRRRWLKVTIDAAQVMANGSELDGELAGNPAGLPSGNGIPGGDAVFYLGNFVGDVDGNRDTVLSDIGLIRDEVNPFLDVPITNVYDVDKDGKVLLGDAAGARPDVSPVFVGPLIAP